MIRARMAILLAGMIAAGFLACPDGSKAGERKEELTRADVVAALENGPGPSRGAAGAPVVMVEFSDFQCGYCRMFWRDTLPKIDEKYIRTGKVRLVYRHMIIRGDASVLAAQAACCAHDQGKFWQYHDTLFAKGSPLAFTAARLKRYAAEVGLDEKTFTACLDSEKHAERVEAETILGHALGATGTPAFLINGQLVLGAYPFEAFQRGLDALLAAPPRGPSGRAK